MPDRKSPYEVGSHDAAANAALEAARREQTPTERESGHLRAVPGPPPAPLVPGHLGAPSYEECAAMAVVIGLYDVTGDPMPRPLAWRIGPWEQRIREWVRREVERGNLDKLTGASDAPA